jgi:uncharacterized protein (DUF952 family)
MTVIYHIARTADWQAAQARCSYAPGSLATEGFIHCSTAAQVVATANRLFRGQRDLLLLCVETSRVRADIHHENLEGGASLFPHVYGALEIDSIVSVHEFPPLTDGSFALPAELSAGR